MRFLSATLLIFGLSVCSALASNTANFSGNCIDSVQFSVSKISCNTHRDGSIVFGEIHGGAPPYFYSIDNQTFTTNNSFERLLAGDYKLVVRDENGCRWDTTLTLEDPEEMTVQLTASTTKIREGQLVELKAEVYPSTTKVVSTEWRPQQYFEPVNTLTQKARPRETTDFAVVVRSEPGCMARNQVTVEVEKVDLYFPNALLPGSNQDNFFTIFAGEGVKRVVNLSIYNRWGVPVFFNENFSPNDPFKGWNGKFHGKKAAPGVYMWMARIEFEDGRQLPYTGDLSVFQEDN